MRVVNLSSGSDGNLTYVETNNCKILVDAGLSCKDIELRLSLLNVNGKDIDAILVTHEHIDHIKGINVFASKFNTKIYCHVDELNILSKKLNKIILTQFHTFTASPFNIKDITINAFKIPHDSVCCVGFKIVSDSKIVSFCTDLGFISDNILQNIYGSQLVYLESNHDIKMLNNNLHYPASLKQRILSSKGHLSNFASADAILKLTKFGTKQIVLSHLSKENNSPSLAFDTVVSILNKNGIIEGKDIKIDIASTMPGKIYKIS